MSSLDSTIPWTNEQTDSLLSLVKKMERKYYSHPFESSTEFLVDIMDTDAAYFLAASISKYQHSL